MQMKQIRGIAKKKGVTPGENKSFLLAEVLRTNATTIKEGKQRVKKAILVLFNNAGITTGRLIVFILVALVALLQGEAAAMSLDEALDNIYCGESYNEYRKITYWGRAYIEVSDIAVGSEDAASLKLTNDEGIFHKTSKVLVEHFKKEFTRLVKGKLPYFDTDEGYDKRMAEFLEKNGGTENIGEKLMAYEEARRTALYGTNPGGVDCFIKIKRRTFPVLYMINCSISPDKSYALVNETDLSFSAAEYIEAELKRAISEQLAALGKKFNRIRACKLK